MNFSDFLTEDVIGTKEGQAQRRNKPRKICEDFNAGELEIVTESDPCSNFLGRSYRKVIVNSRGVVKVVSYM